MELRLDEQVKW